MNYTWDSEKRLYLDASGAVVPEEKVRSWIDDFAAALALLFMGRARNVLETLIEIEINATAFRDAVANWNNLTRADLTGGHIAAVVVAYGGFNVIAPENFAIAERETQVQLSFWDNFVAGVLTGAVQFDGSFVSRTGMYADAIYSTYIKAVRQREIKAGMTEERNILGDANHCTGDNSCIKQSQRGWVAIGSLVAVGERTCLSRCRCWLDFR